MTRGDGAVTRPDELAKSFRETPANRHLGLRLVECSTERAVVSMDARPEFVQEEGVIHGGILSALADTAAVYVLQPGLAPGKTMTSIEFKMNFLRPATADRGTLQATARCVRRGRKVGVCDVEVTQAQRPVARGLFTYLFYEPDDPPPTRN